MELTVCTLIEHTELLSSLLARHAGCREVHRVISVRTGGTGAFRILIAAIDDIVAVGSAGNAVTCLAVGSDLTAAVAVQDDQVPVAKAKDAAACSADRIDLAAADTIVDTRRADRISRFCAHEQQRIDDKAECCRCKQREDHRERLLILKMTDNAACRTAVSSPLGSGGVGSIDRSVKFTEVDNALCAVCGDTARIGIIPALLGGNTCHIAVFDDRAEYTAADRREQSGAGIMQAVHARDRVPLAVEHARKFRQIAGILIERLYIGRLIRNGSDRSPVVGRRLLRPVVDVAGIIQHDVVRELNIGVFHAVAVAHELGKSGKLLRRTDLVVRPFDIIHQSGLVFSSIPCGIRCAVPDGRSCFALGGSDQASSGRYSIGISGHGDDRHCQCERCGKDPVFHLHLLPSFLCHSWHNTILAYSADLVNVII